MCIRDSNGTLSLSTDPAGAPVSSFTQADIDAGILIYTHSGSETVADSFAFMVSDGVGNTTSSQTFNIMVTPVNEPPAGTDITLMIDEDTLRGFMPSEFGFNDVNEGDGFQSVVITTLPAGSLTLNNSQVSIGTEVLVADIPSLEYLPVAEINGANADSFTFQVRDDGGTANGGVDLDPVPRTITFDITSVNDIPVVDLDVDDSTLSGSDFTTSFTTGGTPVLISDAGDISICLLYTSPSPRDATLSRMPSSA